MVEIGQVDKDKAFLHSLSYAVKLYIINSTQKEIWIKPQIKYRNCKKSIKCHGIDGEVDRVLNTYPS